MSEGEREPETGRVGERESKVAAKEKRPQAKGSEEQDLRDVMRSRNEQLDNLTAKLTAGHRLSNRRLSNRLGNRLGIQN